jgi:stress-induced morphogen
MDGSHVALYLPRRLGDLPRDDQMMRKGKTQRVVEKALKELEPSYVGVESLDDGEVLKLWVISEKFEDKRLLLRFRMVNNLLEKNARELCENHCFVFIPMTEKEYTEGWNK